MRLPSGFQVPRVPVAPAQPVAAPQAQAIVAAPPQPQPVANPAPATAQTVVNMPQQQQPPVQPQPVVPLNQPAPYVPPPANTTWRSRMKAPVGGSVLSWIIWVLCAIVAIVVAIVVAIALFLLFCWLYGVLQHYVPKAFSYGKSLRATPHIPFVGDEPKKDEQKPNPPAPNPQQSGHSDVVVNIHSMPEPIAPAYELVKQPPKGRTEVTVKTPASQVDGRRRFLSYHGNAVELDGKLERTTSPNGRVMVVSKVPGAQVNIETLEIHRGVMLLKIQSPEPAVWEFDSDIRPEVAAGSIIVISPCPMKELFDNCPGIKDQIRRAYEEIHKRKL